MSISRQVQEGRQVQGQDEIIAYTITTTPWGGTPANIAVKAFNITASGQYDDVTTANLSGTATANGDIITLPKLQSLIPGNLYRVEVKWTYSGNTFEPYFEVQAER